jgi:hypothetical protein
VFCAFRGPHSPAEAFPRQVKGGQTALEVNVNTFLALINDGFSATTIAPATLQYGATPTAYFPIRSSGGVFDPIQGSGLVPHKGGLRMSKGSTTVDTTNLTIKCDPVLNCSLLGTGLKLVPTEVVQIQNPKVKRSPGTITLTGVGVFREPTVTVLNTLFNTTVFQAGMELGVLTATMKV